MLGYSPITLKEIRILPRGGGEPTARISDNSMDFFIEKRSETYLSAYMKRLSISPVCTLREEMKDTTGRIEDRCS